MHKQEHSQTEQNGFSAEKQTFDEFLFTLKEDMKRYNPGLRKRGFLQLYTLYPGFCFTFWFRLRRFCQCKKWGVPIRPLFTWLVVRQSKKTGIQVHPACQIGPGLYMPHFGGIVVNPKTIIGKNLYLSHNVLIGKVHSGPKKGVPIIGNDVFIGTGAAIVGNVKIGDGAAIGINSVVLEDVLPAHFVAGSPARVVSKKFAGELLGYSNK